MGNSRRDNPRGNALPCFGPDLSGSAYIGRNPHAALKIFPLFVYLLLCACQMDLRTGTTANRHALKSGPAVDGKKLFVAMPPISLEARTRKRPEKTHNRLCVRNWRASVQAVYASRAPRHTAAASPEYAVRLIDLSILDWDDPPASFQRGSDKGEISLSVMTRAQENCARPGGFLLGIRHGH